MTKDTEKLLLEIQKRIKAKQPIDDLMGIKGKAFALLENQETGEMKLYETDNIVTDAGDLYYAKKAAGEGSITPDFSTGHMVLGTAGNAPGKASNFSDITAVVSGSDQAFDAGYPKRNDDDVDNPGRGTDIVTYRRSYTTAQANAANIDRVAIGDATPSGSEALLMYAVFGAAFTKTSSDTLKVWVNHTFNGV